MSRDIACGICIATKADNFVQSRRLMRLFSLPIVYLEDCLQVHLTFVWQDFEYGGCFYCSGVLSSVKWPSLSKISELVLIY